MFETGDRPYLETKGLIFRFDGINREKRKRILGWIDGSDLKSEGK